MRAAPGRLRVHKRGPVLVLAAVLVLLASLLQVVTTQPEAESQVPTPPADSSVITVRVGGDRDSGSGSVAGLAGVTLELLEDDSTGGFFPRPIPGEPVGQPWSQCVSDADGDCSFVIPNTDEDGANEDARFWVRQVVDAAPDGWYDNGTLVTDAGFGGQTSTDYVFRTGSQLRSGQTYSSGSDFMLGTGSGSTASGGIWQVSRDNPPFLGTCGLNVALVVDLSSSIALSGDTENLKNAAKALPDALVGTPSQVGLFTFGTTAPANNTNNQNRPLTPVSTQAGSDQVKSWIDGFTIPDSDPFQFTNWDRGLSQVAASGSAYDAAVVLTDGNPTRYADGQPAGNGDTRFREVENGIFSANAVKARDIRVVTFGVGDGVTGEPDNLRAISGETEDVDFFRTDTFDEVADTFRSVALQGCEGAISVVKEVVPNTSPPGSTDDSAPAGGWTFDATSSEPVDPSTGVTDAGTGAVSFAIELSDQTPTAPVTITETVQPGFTPVQVGGDNAVCTRLDTGASVPVTNAGTGAFTVTSDRSYPVSCTVYNRAPAPGASIVVDKEWVVDGVTYEEGQQPLGLVASLTVDGSSQGWGVPRTGFQEGDDVEIDENVIIGLRQCTLDSQTVTEVNGGSVAEALPYTATLSEGPNTVTVTNVVTCRTILSLTKTVINGDADADDWTLTATAPSDVPGALPGPSGTSTVTADVTPTGVANPYVLSESGDPRYVQRADENATPISGSTVSWNCVEVGDDLDDVIPGYADGLNGGVSVPLGTWVKCDAANETAQLTLVKNVVNDDGGSAVPADWDLTATPTGPGVPPGLSSETVTGSGSFFVRPGQEYTLSESGPAGYAPDGWTCVDGAGGSVEPEGLTLAPGDDVTCTLVNDDQAAALSLTKDVSPATFDAEGDTLTYTYTVSNTGDRPLTNVVVTDDRVLPSAIDCGDGVNGVATLAPGESVTCSAVYTVFQSDVDAGSVTNTGTADSSETDPVTDQATANADQSPALTLLKSALPTTVTAAGQSVSYFYLVTNTGNVTLSNTVVTDDRIDASLIDCEVGSNTILSLAPGESLTCAADYVVTQADIDSGSIDNTGTATNAAVPPVTDDETVDVTQSPAISIVKDVAESQYQAVGDELTYTYMVENSGNVTLTDVTVTDDKLPPAAISCDGGTNVVASLAPGDSVDCTATYAVTQADLDAVPTEVVNTATAVGTPPQGADVQDTDSATVPGAPAAAIDVIKSVTPQNAVQAGQTLTYTYDVTNIGNVTLSSVTVTDDRISDDATAIDCDGTGGNTVATLAPGESFTCTATYVVTQADMDAPEPATIVNTATAQGTPPTGAPVTDTDAEQVTVLTEALLNLVKTVTPLTFEFAGDTLTYDYTVTNAGNVTLTDVTVTDDRIADDAAAIDCDGTGSNVVASLAPGESFTCSATYAVTQADVDAGLVTNIATADSTESEPALADATASLEGLSVVKSAAPATVVRAGETVTYTYEVTNTGLVPLTNLVVTDDRIADDAADIDCDGTGSNTVATLAPGASFTCTADYVVTQADMDAGQIVNTVTADSDETSPVTDREQVTAAQVPALSLVKDVAPATFAAVGETLSYTYTVENIGNQTLSKVIVTDDRVDDSAIDCDATGGNVVASLAPGESFTCEAAYDVTQADVDAGAVTNVAGAASDEAPLVTDDATATSTAEPGLTIAKSADVTSVSAVGETVTYTYDVTNTGALTLSGIVVTDDRIDSAEIDCDATGSNTVASLAPGASVSCTASYVVTQADLDAGEITNVATVDSDQTPPTDDQETVPVDENAVLTLTKDVIPTTYDTVGQTVTYSYEVTNAGNVTLSGISVTDDRLPAAGIVCDSGTNMIASLAPGETQTCTATYTVTQADLDAGQIVNVATADSDRTPPVQDSATTTADPSPGLTVAKTVDPDTYSTVGQTLTYSYEVVNTGNVTIADVAVTDDRVADAAITCESGTNVIGDIAPAETVTCTATYVVTQADIDAASVTNTVTVDSPQTEPVTDEETATANQTPGLGLEKTVDPQVFERAGDELTYTYEVTNTGNTTLTNVAVTDDRINPGSIQCEGASNIIASLAPGASVACTGTYAVTQADVDAGSVTNVGTAMAGPLEVTDDATATGAGQPALSIVKSADPALVTAAGETVTYTYEVSNPGVVTLTNVTVTDDLIAASEIDCGAGDNVVASLSPGATVTCTADYVVTQADMDAGSIVNVATADSDQGTPVTDTETVTAGSAPDLTVVKTPDSLVVSAGGEVTYTYEVTNSGNVTLSDITISDDTCAPVEQVGGSAGDLAVGETRTFTCTATLDTDTTNVVTVGGTAPDESVVTDDDTATVRVAEVDIALTKEVDQPVVSVGDTVTFTLTAANLGVDGATGVVIGNALDEGLTLVSATPSTGTFDDTTGTWSIPSLAAGASTTLALDVRVDGTGSPLACTAVLESVDQGDSNPDNNEGAASVSQDARLGITKVASNDRPFIGDEIDYTIDVVNNGPSRSTGTLVIDELAAGLRYVSSVADVGAYDPATGRWPIGTLEVDQTVRLVITVVVEGSQGITNVARVQGDQTPDDPSDPDDNRDTEVIEPQDPDGGTGPGPDPGPGDGLPGTGADGVTGALQAGIVSVLVGAALLAALLVRRRRE